jgi:hypothetical protein
MKTYFKHVFFLLTILAIFGCNKRNAGNIINDIAKPLFWINSWPYHSSQGSFNFYVHRSGCNSKVYYMSGTVYRDTAQRDTTTVDGGLMSIGGLSFNPNISNDNHYGGPIPLADTGTAKNNFGTTVSYNLAGNTSTSIDAFPTSLYIPVEIKLTNPGCCQTGISISNSLTITWNADPNNNKGVYISVVYDGPTSHARNSTFSNITSKIDAWATDNGSYTFSSSDITSGSFPVGGIAYVVIGRGNSAYVNTINGQWYQVSGYTDCVHYDYFKI